MSDKGINLHKELAMPKLNASAEKEAVGTAPKHKDILPAKETNTTSLSGNKVRNLK
jgi:hypothetical protein